MTAALLALLESDPVAGVLAVADLREQRANAAAEAAPPPWRADFTAASNDCAMHDGHGEVIASWYEAESGVIPLDAELEHIAVEASPAHVLADAALWRHMAEAHQRTTCGGDDCWHCGHCYGQPAWPCRDLLAVVAAARAYLGASA